MRLPSMMMSLPLLLLACNNEDPDLGGNGGSGDDSGASGGGGDDSGTSEVPAVTWHRDIKPVVQTYCARCHVEGGGGPFDLTDPETAALMAGAMAAAVEDGRMPPPASDPDCRPYEGWERMAISDEARKAIIEWAEAGAPLGDPEDAAGDIAPLQEVLPSPDLAVQLPTPYAPAFADADNPGNEYRCFYLEHGQAEDFFVTGMAPLVDARALVHHIVLFTIPEADVPADYDPALGVDCIDGMSAAVQSMIAAWAPGMLPITFPEGVGMRIGADERLAMQMHYYAAPDAPGAADRSGYAFTTAPDVEKEVLMLPLGATDFSIPAGDDDYTFHAELEIPSWLPIEATLYGTFPHMHVLGTGYRSWVDRGGESTCLVESDRYDFNNQLTYMFEEPFTVVSGDVLHLECTWDNSTSNPDLIHDPPVDVGYGERTDEEMCYAFTLATFNY